MTVSSNMEKSVNRWRKTAWRESTYLQETSTTDCEHVSALTPTEEDEDKDDRNEGEEDGGGAGRRKRMSG